MTRKMLSRLINSGINCTVHIHNGRLNMRGKQLEAMDPSSMVTIVHTGWGGVTDLDEMKTFSEMKRNRASIKRSFHT